jgi:hypothetical protein
MTDMSETHASAAGRLSTATDQRDRRSEECDEAADSSSQLTAFVELRAADEQVSARRKWLDWVKEGE